VSQHERCRRVGRQRLFGVRVQDGVFIEGTMASSSFAGLAMTMGNPLGDTAVRRK